MFGVIDATCLLLGPDFPISKNQHDATCLEQEFSFKDFLWPFLSLQA